MATTLYCPHCGTQLTNQGQQADYRRNRTSDSYIIYACEKQSCKVSGATTCEESLVSNDFQNQWHISNNFDIYTGGKN